MRRRWWWWKRRRRRERRRRRIEELMPVSRHREIHAYICVYMQYVVSNVIGYMYVHGIHTGTHASIKTSRKSCTYMRIHAIWCM
jgi:hypothetical protein